MVPYGWVMRPDHKEPGIPGAWTQPEHSEAS